MNDQDIISTSRCPPLLFSFVPTSSKAKLLFSYCCYNTRKTERAMDVHDLSEEPKRGLHTSEESSDDLCVDFRGRPCRQDKHGGTRAALFVLGILPALVNINLCISSYRLEHVAYGWLGPCYLKLVGCVYMLRPTGLWDDGDCGCWEQLDHIRFQWDAFPFVQSRKPGD